LSALAANLEFELARAKPRHLAKVFPQPWQRPRRISIQSWCSSCACLRRCPWPIIESRSQAGHRRKMTSAQLAAQSVSRLYGGTESGINRIVAHWSSVLRRWPDQDLGRKRSSFLLKQKIQLEENTASRLW